MNPKDYKQLIDRQTEANLKAATARRRWIAAINNPHTMNDEELEEHHWECNDRRTEYLRCRAEASEILHMVNTADRDKL